MWRDINKDGVFQQVEKLTDEEMAQYDYKWEFTGKSINGEVGAQANTSNEDIVIPATNREAAQTYGAQAEMACRDTVYACCIPKNKIGVRPVGQSLKVH